MYSPILLQENFHTHTKRCHHALGSVVDYAKAASFGGALALGISDHTPLPDHRWPDVRMDLADLPDYVEEIRQAALLFPEIRFYRGLECEYAPEYLSFYREELLGHHQMDYLIGGAHYFPYQGSWRDVYGGIQCKNELFAYTDYVIDTLQSGLFLFMAHPDLFANCYLTWDKEAIACSNAILQAASQVNVPLEINGYGFRKPWLTTPHRPLYPLREFWELASHYDVKVVINSDAHAPADVLSNLKDCLNLAGEFSLKVIPISSLLP